jgi:putative phosphoesterase
MGRVLPRRTATIRFALFVVIGAIAWVALLPFVPAVSREIGPVRISGSAGVGAGTTSLVAPPLGAVWADTHDGPLDVEISLAEIDVAELESRVRADPSLSSLTPTVEQEIRALANGLALRLLLAGVIAGLLAAALLPRRRPLHFVAAAMGGVIAAVATLVLTTNTFDERAFEQPRFTGALRRAPQVIEAAQQGIESFEALGGRYEALAQRLSRFLAVATDPELDIQSGAVTILHVSDIHSNFLGAEFADRLARAFDVDVVVDTGDLTSFGERVEARVAETVGDIPAPYLFVPGNHDSTANRAAIGDLPGVTLLDEEVEDVDGVDILGWADPTFTADSRTSTEEGNEIRLAEAETVGEAVRRLHPDVLAVHDARLAAESYGDVPVVLAGHTHERSVQEIEGTLVLVVGSTGATGLGSFIVETDIPYEAEIIYLRPGSPVIIDYVSLSGIADEFDVERRVVEPPAD